MRNCSLPVCVRLHAGVPSVDWVRCPVCKATLDSYPFSKVLAWQPLANHAIGILHKFSRACSLMSFLHVVFAALLPEQSSAVFYASETDNSRLAERDGLQQCLQQRPRATSLSRRFASKGYDIFVLST